MNVSEPTDCNRWHGAGQAISFPHGSACPVQSSSGNVLAVAGTYEHIIIRNRAGVTIGHLDAACYLRFTCRKCKQVYRIPPHRLLARYPPWMNVDRIARNTGCRTCATRQGSFATVRSQRCDSSASSRRIL